MHPKSLRRKIRSAKIRHLATSRGFVQVVVGLLWCASAFSSWQSKEFQIFRILRFSNFSVFSSGTFIRSNDKNVTQNM